jgi:hypothetical protein
MEVYKVVVKKRNKLYSSNIGMGYSWGVQGYKSSFYRKLIRKKMIRIYTPNKTEFFDAPALAFEYLQIARHFVGQVEGILFSELCRNNMELQIWRAKAEPAQKIPVFIHPCNFDNDKWNKTFGETTTDTNEIEKWPGGTVFCDSIKLIQQIK